VAGDSLVVYTVFHTCSGVLARLRAGAMKGPPHMDPVLCSIADAARILGIGKTKTYELISDEVLECVAIGTRRLVKVSSINRLVEAGTVDRAA